MKERLELIIIRFFIEYLLYKNNPYLIVLKLPCWHPIPVPKLDQFAYTNDLILQSMCSMNPHPNASLFRAFTSQFTKRPAAHQTTRAVDTTTTTTMHNFDSPLLSPFHLDNNHPRQFVKRKIPIIVPDSFWVYLRDFLLLDKLRRLHYSTITTHSLTNKIQTMANFSTRLIWKYKFKPTLRTKMCIFFHVILQINFRHQ